eukprot:216852_1
MTTRIPFTFKSLTSRFPRMALYSSTTLVLGASVFYKYHSNQPSIIANNNLEATSYSSNELFHDYASSSNTNKIFQRITIPTGKASVINYNPINKQNDLHHILITVQGEGEVHYQTPTNDKIINGMNSIIKKELKLGNSVGIPSTNWHQIVNKHHTKDLVLVVTSVPQKEQNEN